MAVLVLGTAALAISLSLLMTGADSQRSALISQRYIQAQNLARYCGEEALLQIHDNVAFTTPAAGTTLNVGQGSCTYIVAVQTPATRLIRVRATVGSVMRKIQAITTIGASTITVGTWQDEDVVYSAISQVQNTTSSVNTTATTIAQTFQAAVTAGNMIVAAVSWDTVTSVGTLTCSDDLGNTYSTVNIWNDTTNTQALGICYAPNSAAGTPTVTATFSVTHLTRRIIISEYSGVATVTPVDVSGGVGGGTGTTTANATTSGAVVPTKDGDLIYGAVMDTGGTATIAAGTGFTQRAFTNVKDLSVEDFQQGTAASIASTWTFGTAHRYDAAVVAFKAATN
jgi:hypothetical protein